MASRICIASNCRYRRNDPFSKIRVVVDRICIILYHWGHRGGTDGFSTQVPAGRTFPSPGYAALQRLVGSRLFFLLQIVGYLSAGMVFTCSAANTLVYTDRGTMQAAGAGHIILSIVQVCTTLRFARQERPNTRLFVCLFADHLDLLFRIEPRRVIPCIRRLLRPPQGSKTVSEYASTFSSLPRRQTTHEHQQSPCATDVY